MHPDGTPESVAARIALQETRASRCPSVISALDDISTLSCGGPLLVKGTRVPEARRDGVLWYGERGFRGSAAVAGCLRRSPGEACGQGRVPPPVRSSVQGEAV